MTLSRLLASAAAGAILFAGAAQAEPITFSGTVAGTTDYVFRGISQTDEDPAIQAGITVTHETGFFVGAWGSNVDDNFIPGSNVEIDLLAGYSNEVGDFAYSFIGTYYTYPGQDDGSEVNYFELGFTPSYTVDKVKLTGQVWWSPEYSGAQGGSSWYVNGGAALAATDEISLYANVGYSTFEELTDYWDWQVGISYTWESLTFDVKYTDTDLKGSDIADERVIGTVTFAF